MKQFCLTFAGVVGSSKTPIAYSLSARFNLPIHNNDAIRTEIMEDFGSLIDTEYLKRRDERLKAMLKSGHSFILDASVDREWRSFKEMLIKHKYRWFVISLDFSRDLLMRLHRIKGYDQSLARIDQLIKDHQLFCEEFSEDTGIHLKDKDFLKRLKKSEAAVDRWMKKL